MGFLTENLLIQIFTPLTFLHYFSEYWSQTKWDKSFLHLEEQSESKAATLASNEIYTECIHNADMTISLSNSYKTITCFTHNQHMHKINFDYGWKQNNSCFWLWRNCVQITITLKWASESTVYSLDLTYI